VLRATTSVKGQMEWDTHIKGREGAYLSMSAHIDYCNMGNSIAWDQTSIPDVSTKMAQGVLCVLTVWVVTLSTLPILTTDQPKREC
jgi:hypothetical protein